MMARQVQGMALLFVIFVISWNQLHGESLLWNDRSLSLQRHGQLIWCRWRVDARSQASVKLVPYVLLSHVSNFSAIWRLSPLLLTGMQI
jgi:hypothetical protein